MVGTFQLQITFFSICPDSKRYILWCVALQCTSTIYICRNLSQYVQYMKKINKIKVKVNKISKEILKFRSCWFSFHFLFLCILCRMTFYFNYKHDFFAIFFFFFFFCWYIILTTLLFALLIKLNKKKNYSLLLFGNKKFLTLMFYWYVYAFHKKKNNKIVLYAESFSTNEHTQREEKKF